MNKKRQMQDAGRVHSEASEPQPSDQCFLQTTSNDTHWHTPTHPYNVKGFIWIVLNHSSGPHKGLHVVPITKVINGEQN